MEKKVEPLKQWKETYPESDRLGGISQYTNGSGRLIQNRSLIFIIYGTGTTHYADLNPKVKL